MQYARFVLIIAPLFLSACGKDEVSRAPQYDYTFTETGVCTTGLHSYSRLPDLCAALTSMSSNNNCAESLRENYFQSQCPGQVYIRSY